jgi:hypothetical protein
MLREGKQIGVFFLERRAVSPFNDKPSNWLRPSPTKR